MTSGSGTSGSSASSTSSPATILRVLVRPRQALEAAAANRSWVGVALWLALVQGLVNALFLSTEVGQLALVDQWERTASAFGGTLDDATYVWLQTWSERFGALYAMGSALLRGPVLSALVAVLLSFALRGTAHGRPVFASTAAVVVHASVILTCRDLVAVPVSYVREALTAPGSLGLWFPVLDASAPLARVIGVVDAFVVWWLMVLAIGVSVLHGRPARQPALILLGAYLVAALLLAMARADAGA